MGKTQGHPFPPSFEASLKSIFQDSRATSEPAKAGDRLIKQERYYWLILQEKRLD
jgi:hypothetical protein